MECPTGADPAALDVDIVDAEHLAVFLNTAGCRVIRSRSGYWSADNRLRVVLRPLAHAQLLNPVSRGLVKANVS